MGAVVAEGRGPLCACAGLGVVPRPRAADSSHASTGDNGPLRVIPDSHLAGVLRDDEILDLARAREKVEALVPRGGVLAMRPLLVHSSSKARSGEPRRVLHIEYACALELKRGLRLAIA